MLKKEDGMPDIWGSGQLFAFSGLDGHTNWTEPFVLHTDTQPGCFIIRLPAAARIIFEGLSQVHFSMILSDVLVADTFGGRFRAAFLDQHTLIGEKPLEVKLTVDSQIMGENPGLIAENHSLSLFGISRGQRWALLVTGSGNGQNIADHCQRALRADLNEAVKARAAYVRNFTPPRGLNAKEVRLLRKAISVMKVNTESPCGHIRRRWTTPDRWPHRNMWLWDSAFQAIGFSGIDPDMAKDTVLAMLEQVQENGLLPHMISPQESTSLITQPPILAWAALTILKRTADHKWARSCLPYLFRYLEWIRLHRDQNGNALPEWFLEENPRCRCGESGLDNSPRFDKALPMDAVDFASFLSNDYQSLAEIAEQLGDKDMRGACAAQAQGISAAVNKLLWSESEGFYFDRWLEGNLTGMKAVSGFMPLFAGIADTARAQALKRHLRNPQTFGAPFPVPSISLDSGVYSKDMWRGPTWINFNYLVYLGLLRYGFKDEAQWLREKTLAAVERWYEKEGCLFEYYDSLAITSPRLLDRKQRLSTGEGIAPISDYHWTAALTATFILSPCFP